MISDIVIDMTIVVAYGKKKKKKKEAGGGSLSCGLTLIPRVLWPLVLTHLWGNEA